MHEQVHPRSVFPGLHPAVSSLPTPSGRYSPRVLAPRRRRGRCRPERVVGAPLPRCPQLVPGLVPTTLPRPACGPRSAVRLLTLGARRGARGGWDGSSRSAEGSGPRPPTFNSGLSAPSGTATPAAEREPGGAGWGGGETGGGARDHSSGGDQVRRRQFGSSFFVFFFSFSFFLSLPWERQERTSSERLRTRFLEGRGAVPYRGHAPSVIRLAPLTPIHPAMSTQELPTDCLLSATTTLLNSPNYPPVPQMLSKPHSIISQIVSPNYRPLIPKQYPQSAFLGHPKCTNKLLSNTPKLFPQTIYNQP